MVGEFKCSVALIKTDFDLEDRKMTHIGALLFPSLRFTTKLYPILLLSVTEYNGLGTVSAGFGKVFWIGTSNLFFVTSRI